MFTVASSPPLQVKVKEYNRHTLKMGEENNNQILEHEQQKY